MKRMIIAALALSCAFATGCSKGMDCADGAYKSTDPAYCIKLSPGMEAGTASGAPDSRYIHVSDKGGTGFAIMVEKPDDLDKRSKVVANMGSKDLKLVEQGDIAGKKGKFFHFHNGPGNYDFAQVMIAGKDHFYRCDIQNTAPANAKSYIDACKTLSGP